ncbi:protein phosphatase 2A (calcineurin-like phosphoesterase) [Colletotrichum tofieldiae]|uniref:Serine/threonine-protein phosphatase n=1 Tax=Colletotrichum tofieldiae TaxID=708197 RepID=A0A161VIX8_9PEZI|nr:protein phosphatase 2A (calcineurin-like phosphoesterase) [Colletotrichum tofieldiae]
MDQEVESSEDKDSVPIDAYPETFPAFNQATIPSVPAEREGSPKPKVATKPGYQLPSEEEIQAAIRRANQYQNNPVTNGPRRRPGAGGGRQRSAEISFQLPSALPNHLQAQSPTCSATAPTTSSPTVASSLRPGQRQGISVPGKPGYIPTLPPLSTGRPRAPNFSRPRPIVVGGYDNPLEEHQQRVLRRQAADKLTLEAFLEESRRRIVPQRPSPRPLPEPPTGSSTRTAVAPDRAFQAPPPAQNTTPPHPSPLQSNPVALNQQEPFPAISSRRSRSASLTRPSIPPPFAFPGPIGNRLLPESIKEEPPTEDEELDHAEEPEIRTAQIARLVRPSDDPAKDSSDVSLRGGSLDSEDFADEFDEFDPDYYESEGLEYDLAQSTEQFNPYISEEFDPYEVEVNSQLRAQVLDKMASHIPRPGPANLSPNAGLDEWLEEAKQCHYLPERAMKELCELVKEVLMEESNIQPVCTPVTICGDIHGQFYDLLELFRVAGGMPGETRVEAPKTATTVISPEDIEPPTEITNPRLKKKVKNAGSPPADEEDDDDAAAADTSATSRADSAVEVSASSQSAETRFVFLGDFVDRGYFSLETFTLLMCLKAKYPDRIVLVRGNHESRQITQVYGFYEECQQKYGNASVWKACCHVFDFLVLAAIVDGELLCVHGGLSPEIRTIDQIRVVARAQEIPHEGAFCDLVWSDPEDVETWAISPRGAGWLFGDKVATEFNHVNGLKLIARAHQLVNEGYKYHFPQNSVVTVWSAPNYCYRCGNVASIMTVDKDMNPKFSIFSAVPDDQRHVPANRRGPGDYFL